MLGVRFASSKTLLFKVNDNMNSMIFGTVRCFDPKLGTGWISPKNGDPDIRILQSAINHANLGQIAIGQTLGFNVADANRTAVNLWATWSNR